MNVSRRILFAPDSFKGSLRASAAARALADGWLSVSPGDAAVLLPIADGGEGTLDAFEAAVPGALRMHVTVTGPDGRPTDAAWLLLPPTPDAPDGIAVVELATTSGLELLGGRLRGLDADTTGVGQAMSAALRHGVSRLLVGIGSSASTDGGTGLLTVLGARFTDASGDVVAPGARGVARIASADLSGLAPLPPGGVVVLTDVTSPLRGPAGAAAVFGPQKGLAPDDITETDAALARLAALLPADPATPGAGAAGGAGFGLLAWGATIVAGADEVARLAGLAEAVAEASVVVTGEGSFDAQSAFGKGPGHVVALARAAGVPVAIAAGRIAPDAVLDGVAATTSLTELAGSSAAALAEPERWLLAAGAALAREVG